MGAAAQRGPKCVCFGFQILSSLSLSRLICLLKLFAAAAAVDVVAVVAVVAVFAVVAVVAVVDFIGGGGLCGVAARTVSGREYHRPRRGRCASGSGSGSGRFAASWEHPPGGWWWDRRTLPCSTDPESEPDPARTGTIGSSCTPASARSPPNAICVGCNSRCVAA